MGGDEDPIPPDGDIHPIPQPPFHGIWKDVEFHAPEQHNAPAQDDDMPHVNTPPLSPIHPHGAPAASLMLPWKPLIVMLQCK